MFPTYPHPVHIHERLDKKQLHSNLSKGKNYMATYQKGTATQPLIKSQQLHGNLSNGKNAMNAIVSHV